MYVVVPELEDVPGIVRLIAMYSQIKIIIKRSAEEIISEINNFRVIKIDNEVIGCASLYIYNQNLAELRTLLVDPRYHKIGIGSQLVESIKDLSCNLKIRKLFTLTEEVEFFKKKNFIVGEISCLPEKVFKDCQYCRYIKNCRETALWIEYSENT